MTTTHHTRNHTREEDGDPTDLVAALPKLGELHTVYAVAATHAATHHIDRDPDELDSDIYEAETYLIGLDHIAAQFKTLDGETAKHILTGIHAATRHRITVQIHHARHRSGPDSNVDCNAAGCWTGPHAAPPM